LKKHGSLILAAVTLSFAAFTLGFLLGRSGQRETVTVSVAKDLYTLPPAVTTVPEPTGEQIQYPLDLNSATKEELKTIPGIGEILSQRIIDYRTKSGPFDTVDQLMNVYGIGEMLYESIRDYITVLK